MARYVIDAPTLLHLPERGLQVNPGHQLVAPNAIRSEVMQLLLDDVRAGKRTEKAALTTHERLTGLKMRLLGDRVSRSVAWQIARQHDWETLRDAEYLAVARLQADALVTVIQELVGKATNVVPVAPLKATPIPVCVAASRVIGHPLAPGRVLAARRAPSRRAVLVQGPPPSPTLRSDPTPRRHVAGRSTTGARGRE